MNVRMGECVHPVSAITLLALSCVLHVRMGLKGEMANVLVRSNFCLLLYNMCLAQLLFDKWEGLYKCYPQRCLSSDVLCLWPSLCRYKWVSGWKSVCSWSVFESGGLFHLHVWWRVLAHSWWQGLHRYHPFSWTAFSIFQRFCSSISCLTNDR